MLESGFYGTEGMTMDPTNAVDVQLNLRAKQFVPLVDGVDQVAASIERAGATEGMRERGIGREVSVDGVCLLVRSALAEGVHHLGDVFGWVVHFLSELDDTSLTIRRCLR
jgi:hypothetical protein